MWIRGLCRAPAAASRCCALPPRCDAHRCRPSIRTLTRSRPLADRQVLQGRLSGPQFLRQDPAAERRRPRDRPGNRCRQRGLQRSFQLDGDDEPVRPPAHQPCLDRRLRGARVRLCGCALQLCPPGERVRDPPTARVAAPRLTPLPAPSGSICWRLPLCPPAAAACR